ncbi:MAG: NADP-dependent 3-hydroxy acid dehydrogenase YdfG [Desulfovibrio sp.]
MTSASRIICITGATSGIGKAAALRFLKEGWKVIGTGRRAERLAELAREGGENFLPLEFDVSDKAAVAAAFASIPASFKPIDVLVNNAGLALGAEPVMQGSVDDWDVMVDTNIKGLLYCTKAVVNDMAERGRGYIVNIGSMAGGIPYPGGNVYGATKAFVAHFSRNLRTDLHGTGVRVCDIQPGLLETEFSVVRFKGDKNRSDDLYAGADHLLPEDIADIIHYVVTAPERVDITALRVMPTCQSEGPVRVYKKQ